MSRIIHSKTEKDSGVRSNNRVAVSETSIGQRISRLFSRWLLVLAEVDS